MKCKLTKMGVQFLPILSLDQMYWKGIRNTVGETVPFNVYQIEGPGKMTLTHVTQDQVDNGEYDLPLKIQDFMDVIPNVGVGENEY